MFQKLLAEILCKYHLKKDTYPDLEICNKAAGAIYQYWKTIDSHKKLAVYGGGIHTRNLFQLIDIPEGLQCIIDNSAQNQEAYSRPVIPIQELKYYDVDMVLISSYKYRKEMTKEIKQMYPGLEILDFYEKLETQGIHMKHSFFHLIGVSKIFYINEILLHWKETEETETGRDRLQELVYQYLMIRDFVSFKKYCRIYIEKKYEDSKKYEQLLTDIESLLEKIRIEIKKEDEHTTLIFLVDALNKEQARQMSCLKPVIREGCFFEQYISEYPATRQTLQSLLTGWHNLDDELYDKEYLNWDDSELLQYMKKNNYVFQYIGEARSCCYNRLNRSEDKSFYELTSSEAFWLGITNVLSFGKNQNKLVIVHTDQEIHPPHVSADCEWKLQKSNNQWSYREVKRQYDKAVDYIDSLIELYTSMILCSDMNFLIMGDHGHNLLLEYEISHVFSKTESGYWDEEDLHPALIVRSNVSGKGNKIEELICTTDFNQILLGILENNNSRIEKLYGRKYIELQFLPSYAIAWTEQLLKGDNTRIAMGLIGIWNPEETYLCFEDGVKMYFSQEDAKKENKYNNPEYQNKIEKCQRALGRDFPTEILKHPKFKEHNERIKK